jgi:hypothetical protein
VAQHDYVIANGTGAAVRSDLNNALAAIVSQNSGATEPATMYAYQWWADTTTGLLKLRNGANNAWIVLRELDGTLTIEDGTASSPGLAFADDLNTGVFSPGADQVAFTAGGTARLTATTTGITSALPVDVPLGSASAPTVTFTGDLNTGIYSPGADQVAVATNGTGRLFVDASGKILFGTGTARSDFFNTTTFSPRVQIEGTDSNGSMLSVTHNATTGNPNLILARSRGTTLGSATVVSDGDSLGIVQFQGADGTDLVVGAQISANVDGTPGSNDMPGRIVLSTTADGASNPTERMRIDSSGRVGIGTTAPQARLHIVGGSASSIYATTDCFLDAETGLFFSGLGTYNTGIYSRSNSLIFNSGTSGTETARFDSSKRFLVGTSSVISDEQFNVTSGNQIGFYLKNASGGGEYTFKCWNATGTGNTLWIDFINETTQTRRGSIDYNRAAGQVRYNVTSDRRLKSDIESAGTALDALSAIQVRSYKWAETGYQVDHGFIAQELNEIAPDAVKVGDNGEEVTDTWGVDNGKLVPLLTKALQEAIAKIETLEAKVAALESA